MKKIFLTLTLVASFIATAQVKIGANPTVIDGNSLLELETTNQGLLYPRVALQSTTSYAPLNSTLPKQPGMTVYNTATTTTGTNDVTPGLYVNDGFNWIRVTPTIPAADKTLYTDDSAITSARTVTLNNNNLTFTAGVGGTGIMGSDKLKIGANPTAIDANSLLELETTNKGLLYPRVELVRTDSYAPLSAVNPLTLVVEKQKGMTVYNTANTTLYGTNNVTPGLYTNDGTNWVKVTPKTLYTDDSAITSARTVTLNNNDLTFTAGVGGSGKTVVASTFKTGGAVYGKGRTVTRLLTSDWTSTDYAIILTTSGLTINLPDASLPENDGRIIFVANDAGANSSYGGTDDKFKPVNVTTITTARAQQIMSVGGLWHLISGIKN